MIELTASELDVTAEVVTADDGSHAFTVFLFHPPGSDERVGVVVTADAAVAEGLVDGHPGKYVHLHVVLTPEHAELLMEGKIR